MPFRGIILCQATANKYRKHANRQKDASWDSDAPFTVQFVHIANEIFHRTASRTVVPLSAVSNTPYLACKSDGATPCDIVLGTPLDTRPEQADTFAFVADTSIELCKVNSMFHGTALDQVSFWNIGVVGHHAVREAEPDLHILIDFGCAEEDDVAQTFARTVFAGDSVGVGVDTEGR